MNRTRPRSRRLQRRCKRCQLRAGWGETDSAGSPSFSGKAKQDLSRANQLNPVSSLSGWTGAGNEKDSERKSQVLSPAL